MCDFSVDLIAYTSWLKKRVVKPLEPKQSTLIAKEKAAKDKIKADKLQAEKEKLEAQKEEDLKKKVEKKKKLLRN